MSDALPLVSIVTPSFNQGRYLEQTIQSVLGQTYRRIEYILIDGGSTDGSLETIKKHEARLGYWHSGKDEGPADAIHQGFQKSHGEILAWLNSDDLLALDAVANAVEALRRHPEAVMVYGNRICIDQDGAFLYSRPSLPWLNRSPYIAMILGQESCFWARSVYFSAGGMDRNVKFAFDYDLFSKFAKKGPLVHEGSIWGFFRKHPEALTMRKHATLGIKEGRAIQAATWGGIPSPLKWKAVQWLQRVYALGVAPFLTEPEWPACLPPKTRHGPYRRFYRSLHETSRLKHFLKKVAPEKADSP